MTEVSGRLSERVRFEGRDEVRDAAGGRLGGWVYRFERWARVEQQARVDRVDESGESRRSARRWRIGLRAGVRPTLDMRILWRGETLRPTGIEADPGSGLITVWAEDIGT